MRTNIDIDGDLLDEAMVATGLSTKKATVDEALRQLVLSHRRRRALEELDGIGWDGNLDEFRESWSYDPAGMIVVDTSVWIDKFRGIRTEATRKLASADDGLILVGDVVLLEVLQGARDDDHAARLEWLLRRFHVANMLDADLAAVAARNYRRLRRLGITIRKAPDMIIATFCIERGHTLLHQDRDFTPMVAALGLRIA